MNYMTEHRKDLIKNFPFDRDRLSYALNPVSQRYVVYYDIPYLFISLLPVAVCVCRTEAKKVCRTITDNEVYDYINSYLIKEAERHT